VGLRRFLPLFLQGGMGEREGGSERSLIWSHVWGACWMYRWVGGYWCGGRWCFLERMLNLTDQYGSACRRYSCTRGLGVVWCGAWELCLSLLVEGLEGLGVGGGGGGRLLSMESDGVSHSVPHVVAGHWEVVGCTYLLSCAVSCQC